MGPRSAYVGPDPNGIVGLAKVEKYLTKQIVVALECDGGGNFTQIDYKIGMASKGIKEILSKNLSKSKTKNTSQKLTINLKRNFKAFLKTLKPSDCE